MKVKGLPPLPINDIPQHLSNIEVLLDLCLSAQLDTYMHDEISDRLDWISTKMQMLRQKMLDA